MVREGKVVMGQSGSPIDNYASRAEYVIYSICIKYQKPLFILYLGSSLGQAQPVHQQVGWCKYHPTNPPRHAAVSRLPHDSRLLTTPCLRPTVPAGRYFPYTVACPPSQPLRSAANPAPFCFVPRPRYTFSADESKNRGEGMGMQGKALSEETPVVSAAPAPAPAPEPAPSTD